MQHVLVFLDAHWMLVSFMAPALWSVVNLIDIYFVKGVYRDEFDGAIISSLFQSVPWLILVPILGIVPADFLVAGPSGAVFGLNAVTGLSFCAGTIYMAATFFYFKALFNYNDAPSFQIFISLSVIIVPTFAYLIFGERLPLYGYAGMTITLVGVVLLTASGGLREKFSREYLMIVGTAVLLASLSMVIGNHAYGLLRETYGSKGFWIGFMCFGFGASFGGVMLSVFSGRNPIPFIREHAAVFLLGEGVYFIGNLASQRAIGTAPSVSYVAVIETFGPVFILCYSFLIVTAFRVIGRGRAGKSDTVRRLYAEQLDGVTVKVVATLLMAAGVYVMTA